MSTVATLVELTRRHLLSTSRGERNRLAATVTDATLSLSFDFDLGGITANSYVAIGNEICFVLETDRTARTAQVDRGELGTTAVAHTDGDQVYVNPRFPRPFILDALRDEVDSWPVTLFRAETLTLELPTGERALDLGLAAGETVYDVLDVRVSPCAGALSSSWPSVTTPRLLRNQPAASFPSGFAVVIGESFGDARQLLVTVARPFVTTTWTDATDLTAVGLADAMVDIAPLGAAARLLAPKEVQRQDPTRQGEPGSSTDVQPAAILRAADYLEKARDQRINDESARLRALWPIRGI